MDEATHRAKAKEYTEGPLAKLSKYLESHITGTTWLLSKLTIADFWLYGTIKALTDVFVPDAMSLMGPKVQQWKNNFETLKQIKDYNAGVTTPMVKYTYFAVRGRCEPLQMIFRHMGIPHEEVTVALSDWPGTLKEKTPMGYLPVLQVGDTEITSSFPILKYLGNLCGLSGGQEEEECNTLIYAMEDARSFVFPNRFLMRRNLMDEETKAEKIKEFLEKKFPPFQNILEKSITGDKWIFKQLSVADFWLHGTMEIIEDSLVPDVWLRMSPRIRAWRTEFESLPKIKAYMNSRPTEYLL